MLSIFKWDGGRRKLISISKIFYLFDDVGTANFMLFYDELGQFLHEYLCTFWIGMIIIRFGPSHFLTK